MPEEKTVARKGHVKPGTRIAVIDPVPGVMESLGLSEPEFVTLPHAQVVLLFVVSRAQLTERMPQAVAELAPSAILWVLFRKGGKAAGLDMSRDDVWTVAETMGLRPLGLLSVDDTWSAFRLRAAR